MNDKTKAFFSKLFTNLGAFFKKKWVKITGLCLLIAMIVGGYFLTWYRVGHIYGVPSTEYWSPDMSFDEYESKNIKTMAKKPGEDFKILVLADTQMGFGIAKSNYDAVELARSQVVAQAPDLVVLTGDNVSSNSVWAKKLVKALESTNVPYAMVMGNHDSEGFYDRNAIADIYMSGDHSRFRKGPASIYGVGNYIINITEGDKVVETLFFMDSNDYRYYDLPAGVAGEKNPKYKGKFRGYDYIHYDQIAWYEWNVREINKKANGGTYDPTRPIPSMMYFHIGLQEFNYVEGFYANGVLSPMGERPGSAGTLGEIKGKGEGTLMGQYILPEGNTGLFAKIQELRSTTHVTVGHDHINCGVATYGNKEGQGTGDYLVNFVYALKTGRTSYSNKSMQGSMSMNLSRNAEAGTNSVAVRYNFV